MIAQKTLFVGALATLSVAASAVPVFAASLVAPNTADGTPGNSNIGLPFNFSPDGSARLQQVYASSQFSAITSPVFITKISFRPRAADTTEGFGPTTINNVLINLSTTSTTPATSGPNAMRTTFADNIGTDETTVFDGDLTISSGNTVVGPNNLKAFDISIALTTPFLYNPTLGNLLLDIRNPSGGFTTLLDAQVGSSAVGVFTRVQSFAVNKTAVDSLTGQVATGGAITQFGYEPIPTPALLPGLIGMGVATFRKRRSQGEGDHDENLI